MPCLYPGMGFTCDTVGWGKRKRWRSRQQIARDLLPRHLALSVECIASESLWIYIAARTLAEIQSGVIVLVNKRLVSELQNYLWRGHLCLRLRCDVFRGAGRMNWIGGRYVAILMSCSVTILGMGVKIVMVLLIFKSHLN